MIVGYRRSATVEQKAGYEVQHDTLVQAGCEKVFGEMVSSVSERAELAKELAHEQNQKHSDCHH